MTSMQPQFLQFLIKKITCIFLLPIGLFNAGSNSALFLRVAVVRAGGFWASVNAMNGDGFEIKSEKGGVNFEMFKIRKDKPPRLSYIDVLDFRNY